MARQRICQRFSSGHLAVAEPVAISFGSEAESCRRMHVLSALP
jgi:hypothetical protein